MPSLSPSLLSIVSLFLKSSINFVYHQLAILDILALKVASFLYRLIYFVSSKVKDTVIHRVSELLVLLTKSLCYLKWNIKMSCFFGLSLLR